MQAFMIRSLIRNLKNSATTTFFLLPLLVDEHGSPRLDIARQRTSLLNKQYLQTRFGNFVSCSKGRIFSGLEDPILWYITQAHSYQMHSVEVKQLNPRASGF